MKTADATFNRVDSFKSTKGLKARYHPSDLQGACESAYRAAIRSDKPLYVYPGNSYGAFTYRVTYSLADALSFCNNTYSADVPLVYKVEPSGVVSKLA